MKLWSSAFLAIMYSVALVFSKPVPYRSTCAAVTPLEQWQAYKKLVQKVMGEYLQNKVLGIVIFGIALLFLVSGIVQRWDKPSNNWLVFGLAWLIAVIIVAIAVVALYPAWVAFIGTLGSDHIEWPYIKNCLGYMVDDPDLSDACKLDVIKEFAQSSAGSQWGAVSFQGVVFAIGAALALSEYIKSWTLEYQILDYIITFAGGVGTFLNVLYANANTVVFRAVVLWQKDPAQAKKTIGGNASQRKPSPFKSKS